MLMQKATKKMIESWKMLWFAYKDKLKPNRKTGKEVLSYVVSKYPLTELFDSVSLNIITKNVLENEPYAEKLKQGEKPDVRAFIVNNAGSARKFYRKQDEVFKGGDIYFGIDLKTGYYYAENSLLWDELCAFSGLDAKDLTNYFCVVQYIICLKRFDLLQSVPEAD